MKKNNDEIGISPEAVLRQIGYKEFAAKMGAEMIPGLLASIRKATSASKDYSKGR